MGVADTKTDIQSQVESVIISGELELARREVLKEVRRNLLSMANKKQEEAKELRSEAHKLHLLITGNTSHE